MKVKVFAPFEIPGLDASDRIEVPSGTRVRDLMKYVGASRVVWQMLPVSVNGVQVEKSCELKENDVVVFIAPLAGG